MAGCVCRQVHPLGLGPVAVVVCLYCNRAAVLFCPWQMALFSLQQYQALSEAVLGN